MSFPVILAITIIPIIIYFLYSNSVYYGKIYADKHYEEIADWVAFILQKGMVDADSQEDGTTTVTSAGIGLVYTREQNEKGDTLHFSVSQVGRVTTHAVGRRLITFILILLNNNECRANPFYTSSNIHHLVLNRESISEWIINPTDESITKSRECEPITFTLQELEELQESEG
jgi:hypothetical protein